MEINIVNDSNLGKYNGIIFPVKAGFIRSRYPSIIIRIIRIKRRIFTTVKIVRLLRFIENL